MLRRIRRRVRRNLDHPLISPNAPTVSPITHPTNTRYAIKRRDDSAVVKTRSVRSIMNRRIVATVRTPIVGAATANDTGALPAVRTPSGVVDTTFLALDGTYYQAVRTTEEVAGVEVARTVTLPEGSPTPGLRYTDLNRRDRAAFLAADSEGLLTDSAADTREVVRDRGDDVLELALHYPTTVIDGFQLTGLEEVLFAVNGAVLQLTRTDRTERTIRTFRVRFEPRGTTREAVIAPLPDTYGTRLSGASLSAAGRTFLDAAVDGAQTVCTDGSQASPATPTPAPSQRAS